MILLHPNKKGEGQGKKCHTRTMMYLKDDKSSKLNAHHVSLRQTKRYVRWTGEKLRIVENTHTNKQATTKDITNDTSQILSDKSNP